VVMESQESVKAAIGASTRSMAAIVWPSLMALWSLPL
jgi:hypothetical protein